MRLATLMQAAIVLLVAGALAYAVVSDVDNWGDWVVLGVIILTALGTAIAVNQRQYPTGKRSFRRDSDSNW